MNVLDAVKQAVAGFRGLKDSWADTTTARRTLVVTILGGLAEFERSLIRARPGKGRERAKARRRSVRTAAEVHSAPEARRSSVQGRRGGDGNCPYLRRGPGYHLFA